MNILKSFLGYKFLNKEDKCCLNNNWAKQRNIPLWRRWKKKRSHASFSLSCPLPSALLLARPSCFLVRCWCCVVPELVAQCESLLLPSLPSHLVHILHKSKLPLLCPVELLPLALEARDLPVLPCRVTSEFFCLECLAMLESVQEH